MQNLSTYAQDGKRNNLNAIRLFLAVSVVFSHSFALDFGKDQDALIVHDRGQQAIGGLAVDLFFFISGMLVTASWLRSRTMNDFMRRRILRIYPAFVVATVFSVAVASVFALQPLSGLRARLHQFVADIFLLGDSSSSGPWVFPYNPFPHYANGSLWTIPREFLCYLLVALIGIFGLYRRRLTVLCGLLFVYAFYARRAFEGLDEQSVNWRFLTFFLCGTCVWLWRDKIPLHPILAVAALGVCIGAAFKPPLFLVLTPVAGSYLVLCLGYYRPEGRLSIWCDKTDLSYGTYLYAFPIQQSIVALSSNRNPWRDFGVAIPIILGMAFVSWHLVEKSFLRLKSRDFSDHDPGLPSLKPKPVVIPTEADLLP